MTDTRVFRASEVDPNRSGGWIADLSGPDAVNPDCYFRFRTQARAREFLRRVDAGEDAQYVYGDMIEQSQAAAALGRIGGSVTSEHKATTSAANGALGGRPRLTLYERAERRVERSAKLRPHKATILADWPEGDAHWRWVATAQVREIVDWAESIR